MTPEDVSRLLDPQIAAQLQDFQLDFTAMDQAMLGMIREQMGLMPAFEMSSAVTLTVRSVPGAAGDPDIELRIYQPVDAGEARPCVYWVHGGGYIIGDAAMQDVQFDGWCDRFGIVGVSVEYRLAPETPYPGPIEDCYAGLRWVHDNASELGVDPSKIGIGGTSAGGGLCAALGLMARDRAEIPVQFQMLYYPMIDDRMANASHGWPVPVWTPAANDFGWRAYLGGLFGSDDVPYWAAAARAEDLSGLPPTLIAVGGLDGFVDENIDYAARLNRAHVPTELHVYPGAPHGFDGITPNAEVAGRFRRDTEQWLAARLGEL